MSFISFESGRLFISSSLIYPPLISLSKSSLFLNKVPSYFLKVRLNSYHHTYIFFGLVRGLCLYALYIKALNLKLLYDFELF